MNCSVWNWIFSNLFCACMRQIVGNKNNLFSHSAHPQSDDIKLSITGIISAIYEIYQNCKISSSGFALTDGVSMKTRPSVMEVSSSFWHLLYNNLQRKISNWSEIISWCIFAQSRLYAFLKKQFPEITTIACRTIIPCVCVLKVCIELYLLPSSPRLLYFRCPKVPILIEI